MKVKQFWTIDDFKDMSWHDSRIYGLILPFSPDYELRVSIDYIFEWVKAEQETFKFWVSPAELIFKPVSDLIVNLNFENLSPNYISNMTRDNKRLSPNGTAKLWDFKIETDIGEICFTASSLKQTILKQPKLIEEQDLNRKIVFK